MFTRFFKIVYRVRDEYNIGVRESLRLYSVVHRVRDGYRIGVRDCLVLCTGYETST